MNKVLLSRDQGKEEPSWALENRSVVRRDEKDGQDGPDKQALGDFLVVQWLRLHLPMQGTQV